MTPSIVALIPAKRGSQRIRDKNIVPLRGHPLMAYSIRTAIESGIFRDVYVCTNSRHYAAIASEYGAQVLIGPEELFQSNVPDFGTFNHALNHLAKQGGKLDCFAILRPTSPFRTAETIRRCWDAWLDGQPADSIRAIQRVSEHPGKMWVVRGDIMYPLLPWDRDGTPWHSNQYQALPEIHVQNASLEMAWVGTVMKYGTIAGHVVLPFYTEGHEGFDINVWEDVEVAKGLIASNKAILPDLGATTSLEEWTT